MPCSCMCLCIWQGGDDNSHARVLYSPLNADLSATDVSRTCLLDITLLLLGHMLPYILTFSEVPIRNEAVYLALRQISLPKSVRRVLNCVLTVPLDRLDRP